MSVSVIPELSELLLLSPSLHLYCFFGYRPASSQCWCVLAAAEVCRLVLSCVCLAAIC